MQRLPISLPVLASPAVESNRAEIVRGLVYTHNRANANTAELHKTSVTVAALIDLLVEHGIVSGDELNERRKELAEELKQDYVSRGMAVAMQDFEVSKYEFKGGAEIDCENRLHLCKAACCRLPFALSKHDVQEGVVKWDLGQPYMNARDEDGYCAHLNKETSKCTVYSQRPIPCRGYDCRKDKRVWIDFENRVINPLVDTPDWPKCCGAQSQSPTPGQS
jgi:Fe-S-cluster containining protein